MKLVFLLNDDEYEGATPGPSYDDRMSWFNKPDTYEYQENSRKRLRDDEPEILRTYRLNAEYKEKSRSIELQIIKRCLPAPYCKEVGKKTPMYVTEMDNEQWIFFMSQQEKQPTISNKYSHSYPDHGYNRSVEFHRVGWINGNHPNLYTPHWYLT